MMASMGGSGGDHAGEHDAPGLEDRESDDSDDAGPPPLESPAPPV
jgi:hypothetical protein